MLARFPRLALMIAMCAACLGFASISHAQLTLNKGDHISIIGNTLADRMQHDGWLETLIQSRFPDKELVFRNLGYSADEIDVRPRTDGFGSPDEWLTKTESDVIFAFFGYNESFDGEAGLPNFRKKLASFIDHTLSQKYNGKSAPRLVLCSPIAHENLHNPNLPDGRENNARLVLYTQAMGEVAKEKGIPFVDLFTPTKALYLSAKSPLTINGIHLTTEGNRLIAQIIDQSLFGKPEPFNEANLTRLRQAVMDKNLHWFSRYRVIDEYNVFGGRSKLSWHGQSNADVLGREMEVFDVMTANRDKRVWAVARGSDMKVDDSNTPAELKVVTNKPGPLADGEYPFLGGEEAISKMQIAKGMKVNLFASEEQFPELINPVQMAVDPNGRLWVSAWPSYPHWNPKEPRRDKLIILPDDNGDGKADRAVVFADNLNSVTGFEFWGGGVLVAMAPEIWFMKDTDGDDKADVRIRVFHGISSGDSHHTANSLVIGPDGGLYYSHGIFHYDNSETPTGTFRTASLSGVYRFDPRTFEARYEFPIGPNPHGDVFDQWGYHFASDGTSGTGNYIAIGKGVGAPKQWYNKRVRPVPATGILSSSHFPEANQGNFLICNAIGFLGVLQYEVKYNGADITAQEIEPILVSSDQNFRPTDLEIAGDGALYVSDWQNPLIGHMQHNIRDPNRDHLHGRVYRVTAEGRPLLKPMKLMGAPIPTVLEAFHAKENGTRYRARLELSGRDTAEVVAATTKWAASLEPDTAGNEQALLEALWVFEEHRVPNEDLLRKVLRAKEPRVRAAAIRTLGHWGPQIKGWESILVAAARDPEALVRAEAVVAAPSFEGIAAAEAVFEAATRPTDVQLDFDLNYARSKLNIDRMVQDALNSGKPLSPAAMAYALQKASIDSLLKMERTEAVSLALLTRTGVKTADRMSALESLGKFRKTTALAQLLAALTDKDGRFEATVDDLALLLPQMPADQLQSAKDSLHALAANKGNMQVRSAAFAALVKADGSAQRASALAGQSMPNMQAFLGSLQLISDKATLDSVYPAVKQLTHTLPAGLIDPDAKPATVGRYVRVELPRKGTLTLAEVEVMSVGTDIAKGKPAKQSSIASGGNPERAVDGNTNGVYNAGSATHTQENSNNPWWEVDLGADLPIDAIRIWNRTDCCIDRLDGFTLTVLDGNRNPVFTKTDNHLTTDNINFELGGDPAAAVHVAAINALVNIPGHDAETFNQLADLIVANRQRAAAVPAILKIKPDAWSADRAAALGNAMRQFAPTIPLNLRTGQLYKDSQAVAKQVATQLPKAEADKLLADLSNLDLQVIVIHTVPERMIYDKLRFAVVAGKPVRIVLENKDKMPHNLLVTLQGGPEVVGPLAEAMGAEGFKKNFHPESSMILHAMPLVNPDEAGQLDFIAPKKPGDYEYVCTFPGHWRLMRGVMKVVAKAEDLPADSPGTTQPVMHEWKLEELVKDLDMMHHRSFKTGQEAFTRLGCAQCHKMRGQGGAVGPELTEVFKKYKNDRKEVLTQILEPSKIVEEKYRPFIVETKEGAQLFGFITERTKDHVVVVTNPQAPVPQKIAMKDVESITQSTNSLMPQGLLNFLDRGAILDLLAYLESGGDEKSEFFKH